MESGDDGNTTGKNAALRVLTGGDPGGDINPLLIQAEAEINNPRTVLRLRYGLPPGDERIMQLTEEEVLVELLLLHQVAKRNEQEANPNKAMVDALGASADVWKRLQHRADQMLSNPAVQEFVRTGKVSPAESPSVVSIERRPAKVNVRRV